MFEDQSLECNLYIIFRAVARSKIGTETISMDDHEFSA